MGNFNEIEKFMKELDSKYQKKWDAEKKLNVSVDLHIDNKDKPEDINED